MTTPDGRDARSGEELAAVDPSATTEPPSAQGSPQRIPRTPDRHDPSATETAPRTGGQGDDGAEQDQAASG